MDKCCGPVEVKSTKFRIVVWVALALNLGMFFYEFGVSFLADSSSLKADALDFLGDAANYMVSLFVLSRSLNLKAKASILKGLTMAAFGVWVLISTVQSALYGAQPQAEIMGWIGAIALAVNLFVAYLLYQFRDGDSNMQSVWLCSRNDAIGNVAVLGAALGVAYFGTMWPDLVVAALMSYLGFGASMKVLRTARMELKTQIAGLDNCTVTKAEGKSRLAEDSDNRFSR